MSDLISRQAAIDDIKAVYEWHDTVTEGRILDHLRRLPSAQPEIIRCKDCKWYYRGGATCMFWDGANSMCGDDFCGKAEREEE